MTQRNKPGLSATFDRSLAWQHGGSVRYLALELTAPPAEESSSAAVIPINLALVLDVSGSMSGQKLADAAGAAIGAVRRLGAGDVLSIVSFASDVQVHMRGQAVNEHTAQEAAVLLAELTTRGSTNLSEGWLQGAECAAEVQVTHPAHRHQVLLLSDGQANEGILDPEALQQHADQLRRCGIHSSTVGIGDDYDSRLLVALADAGGGRMHDAERGQDLVDVLAGELNQVRTAAVVNLEIVLDLPSHVQVQVACLSGAATRGELGRVLTTAGSLAAGESRALVYRVTTPPGTPGDLLTFKARLRWQRPGASEILESAPVRAQLCFATGKENSPQPRELRVSAIAAAAWQSQVMREAVQLNRNGAFEKARRHLDAELRHFSRYCATLPGGAELVAELERARAAIMQPWQKRSRKEIELAHYKRQRGQADLRSSPRSPWTAYFPEPGH